ncbi:hypothetical protein CHS0354_028785 [Potamilus streckersoni]|uniref:Uncharacterized protein n=1 Tax=Potamilus streckersoni TaxID=2493646 RepID=A0AAE0S8P5_9BIVA|nr:hypothetical protein CHS0354_028785 [Potamilus streckersoni]
MEKGYINAEHSTELLGEMFELWKGNKYCDAVLILQNERYKLHKLVLMAACPNILRYLAHNDVNNIFEIYIPEHVDESAVRLVLDYLYSGTVQLKTDSVYEIEKLANQLRLGTLSRFCHEFISQWETETLSLDQTQDERVQEHILKKLSPGSHLIKTESDASSSFPQVKKTSLTKGNTTNLIPGGTIDTCNPLDNLSEDDQETINCLATTLAAAVCESYDSSLDKESDQDESEEDSESVSNQTSTVKRLDSNQGNTISNPSPGPSRTSTQRPVCGSGDDIDLIMTAEEENDEDSDNNWGPQEDQMDMDYHSESSPEKFTKTKKQKAIIEPKTKRRKLNDKPAEECSGINVKITEILKKRYRCNLCSADYSQSGKLAAHRKRVHEGRHEVFNCSYCNIVLSSKYSKDRHERVTHMGMKNHPCDECDEVFGTKCSLLGHRRRKHGYEKLKCKNCDQEFVFIHNLEDHKRRCGTTYEIFKCDRCTSIFSTRRALKLHSSCKHETKVYACDICGNQYTYPGSLWIHKRKKHTVASALKVTLF